MCQECCRKCVYYWVGLEGCKERRARGCCCEQCPYFVHINSPEGNLMVCEYVCQRDKKKANEKAE